MTKIKKPRKPKSISYEDVLDAENALEEVQHAYLESHGWKYSSDNPMCFWLWSKEFDGKVIMADTEFAILYQRDG